MDYPSPKRSNPQLNTRIRRAFEMIAAIIIILIVRAILFPTMHPGRRSMIAIARQEMKNLEAAINQYHTIYNRWPVSNKNLSAAARNDFTFGTHAIDTPGAGITNSFASQANNSEVMAVVMDMERFIDSRPTANSKHMLNPQRYMLFSAKLVNDTKSHGVGSDGVLRDPWGNPYIITIDLNNDGYSRDAFYRMSSVSESSPSNQTGLNQLSRSTLPPYNAETRDTFQLKGSVMIWSMGQDGKSDPSIKADEGVNKDNILSWN